MTTANELLPEGFQALEPFVEAWAIEGAHNRLQRRLDSEENERVAFFNAAKDLVPAALDFLDKKPLAALNKKECRLMNLCLAMAHIAPAVEIQKDQEDLHARYARYITITRATSDD